MSATRTLLRRLAYGAASAILLTLFAMAHYAVPAPGGSLGLLLDALYAAARVLAGLGPPELPGGSREPSTMVLEILLILAGLAFRVYVFAVVTAWLVARDVAPQLARHKRDSTRLTWLIPRGS